MGSRQNPEKNHLKVRFFSCNAGRGNCIRSGQKAVSDRDSSLEPQLQERLRSFSAESPKASRNRFTAAFSPWSKSTKMSAGQSLARSSSRVTTCPGFFKTASRIWRGWSCSFTGEPLLLSSPVCGFSSKVPNRMVPFGSVSRIRISRAPKKLHLVNDVRTCNVTRHRKPLSPLGLSRDVHLGFVLYLWH